MYRKSCRAQPRAVLTTGAVIVPFHMGAAQANPLLICRAIKGFLGSLWVRTKMREAFRESSWGADPGNGARYGDGPDWKKAMDTCKRKLALDRPHVASMRMALLLAPILMSTQSPTMTP